MKRTCRRPLPTCRISPQAATALAALSGVGGVTLLAVAVNPLTALLGALNIGFATLFLLRLMSETTFFGGHPRSRTQTVACSQVHTH